MDVTPGNVTLAPPSAFGSSERVTLPESALVTVTSVGPAGAAVSVTETGICRFLPTVAPGRTMSELTVAVICPPLAGLANPSG